jgi:large subunit ribosomal protein L25
MQIQAEKRTILGKKNKKIREERKIPAVVYGEGIESTSLTIEKLAFLKIYKEAGETSLIDLKFNDSDVKVLVKEIQVHPVTLEPIHVSFHKVDLTATIKANVPVEITGEEDCPVIKSGEGMLLTLFSEIEVEALPANLPSEFEIDVSHLAEIGAGVTVAELKYDKELVEIVDKEEDEMVVRIDYAEMAEEEEEEEELTEEELIAGVEATEEKEESEEDQEDSTEQPEEKKPEKEE